MFASPGIRKDDRNDQELGEDATGFIIKNDYVAVWVADGAPGRKIRLGEVSFNSRILAKYAGDCFEAIAFKYGTPKIPLTKDFSDEFKRELDRKLRAHLNDVHEQFKQMKKSSQYELFSRRVDDGKVSYVFEWTTTFVGAIINIENKKCSTIQMGDCNTIVNDKIIQSESVRLFVQWTVSEDLVTCDFEIIMNDLYFNLVNDVKSVILTSDGVITSNNLISKFSNKDAEVIWDELKTMNNKTDDDKTAIFLSF